MKLFKFIFPVCIAALSLIQCTNPQTTQTTPTYYVESPAPVVKQTGHQAPLSAQFSSAIPNAHETSTVDWSTEVKKSSFEAPKVAQGEIHYYTNVNGNRVQAPTYYDSPPVGACAQCEDGTYSFSQNRRGTCSRHGGVKVWLR
jgi:hypothetical protein